MKKRLCAIVALFLSCIALFAGCNLNSADTPSEPKEYIIQYSDEKGVYTLSVTEGMPYALEVIPEKTGYNFKGLFDAEVGGIQYVSANGASLSLFGDNKNLILYPQFEPKEYTVILDYQGAAVTGSRQLTVNYGSSLPQLPDIPDNFLDGGKKFSGWYTQANCGGTQIADKYGLIPLVSVLNEQNFDITRNYFYLYAGFEAKKITVTLNFGPGIESETVEVAYNSSVSSIISETRVNNKAPVAWSKTNGGSVFNGKITEDTDLYAVEFAPVIEFDSKGGNSVNPIVSREGDAINLPVPIRENYKFTGWQTSSGAAFNATAMPSESLKLTAQWQAMIIFDTNGGTAVKNISEPQGTKIELPSTEREGYIFAGWYDADSKKFDSSVMPNESALLTAKYYKCQTDTITVLTSSKYNFATSPSLTIGPTYHYYNKIDVGYLLEKGVSDITIKVQYTSWKEKTTMHYSYPLYTSMDWFSSNAISAENRFWSYEDEHYGNSSDSFSRQTKITLTSSELYVCYYSRDKHGKNGWWDFTVTFEYEDKSILF